jgi:hypothetical protein
MKYKQVKKHATQREIHGSMRLSKSKNLHEKFKETLTIEYEYPKCPY